MARENRQKRLVRERSVEPWLTGPNLARAATFIFEGLATGRMVRIQLLIDAHNRERLTPEPDISLSLGCPLRVLE